MPCLFWFVLKKSTQVEVKALKILQSYSLLEQTQVLLKYISQSKCNSLLPTPGNIVVVQK